LNGRDPVRVLVPEHRDPEADQDEREERPDVREVDHLVDAHERADPADEHAGEDRRDVRRAEARVDAREDRREEPVARHREQDARLPELEDQEHGRLRDDRAEGHDPIIQFGMTTYFIAAVSASARCRLA
jgi:hypothetical protein